MLPSVYVGLPKQQSVFALCLFTLRVLVFQSTAVEMKAGEKMEEKYSFSSVSHNPALCCRPFAIPLSLRFPLFSALCLRGRSYAFSNYLCVSVRVYMQQHE